MYKVLIVDDEYYAVRAIVSGVDWSSLHVEEGDLFRAHSAEQAKTIFESEEIDLMVCDIEMPGENGIQLLEWVKDHNPDTEAIFLTCHSEFHYAQQAIRLGSMEYLLKPVQYDALTRAILKGLERIERSRRMTQFAVDYTKYQNQWANQLPLLVERFWQDAIHQRISAAPEQLDYFFGLYNLPLQRDQSLFPVLLSIEEWTEAFSDRDEEILEYALKNAAEELLLQGRNGTVIRDQVSGLLVLYYGAVTENDYDDLTMLCKEYIRYCKDHFYCSLSCYLGRTVEAPELVQVYHALLETQHRNVTVTSEVLPLQAFVPAGGPPIPQDSFREMAAYLENGNKDMLMERLNEFFESLSAKSVTLEYLEAVYYGVLQMVYNVAHKKGVMVYELFSQKEIGDASTHTRGVNLLRGWVQRLFQSAISGMQNGKGEYSAVIRKVKEFMLAHIDKPFSREELASHVYLNPAYLSRLFKKETGMSLTEYALQLHLDEAKRLLVESDYKVHSIAEMVGYENISHFARQFKRSVGLSPQQYRKKYQNIGNEALR